MEEVTTYLGLGTNLGAREDNLNRAAHLLTTPTSIQLLRCLDLAALAALELDLPDLLERGGLRDHGDEGQPQQAGKIRLRDRRAETS